MFVVVVAGPIDGEAPQVGGAAVAEPAQLEDCAVPIASVDVGEVGPEADVDPGEGRPVGADVAVEPGSEVALVEGGGAFIGPSLPDRSGGDALLGCGADALEHGGEIRCGESPVEGSRRLVVAVLEAAKPVGQGVEVGVE